MKILALEFSSPRRSVAILDGETVLAEQNEAVGQNVPPLRLVEQALATAKLQRQQIECVVVGLGPGSYTGIRAAIALAQGWQLAADVKLQGISSAECIAAQAQAEGRFGPKTVVIDAQRGEFYVSLYDISVNGHNNTHSIKIITLKEFDSVENQEHSLIGPEVNRWFSASQVVFPQAATLGRLAVKQGRFVSGNLLEPIYLRETSFIKAPSPRTLPTL